MKFQSHSIVPIIYKQKHEVIKQQQLRKGVTALIRDDRKRKTDLLMREARPLRKVLWRKMKEFSKSQNRSVDRHFPCLISRHTVRFRTGGKGG